MKINTNNDIIQTIIKITNSTSFRRLKSSLTVFISPSLGACITIIVDPIAVKKQPSLPIVLNFSLRKYADKIALIKTDSAPNGVTSVA